MSGSFLGGFVGALLGNGKVIRWLLGRGLILTGSFVLMLGLWWQRQPWSVRAVVIVVVLSLFLIWINRRVQRRARRRRRVISPAPLPDLEHRPHFLYRWYGENDRLLYVGITNNLERRTNEHAADKPWITESVRAEIEPYSTRSAALAAEERAIFSENPVYNVIHNYGWDRS